LIETNLFGEQCREGGCVRLYDDRLLTFKLFVIGRAKPAGFPAAKRVRPDFLKHRTPTSPPPIEAAAFAYTSKLYGHTRKSNALLKFDGQREVDPSSPERWRSAIQEVGSSIFLC
jgi:hypothetical protein